MAPQTPNATPPNDDEEPLDPKLEAVALKMRRLSLVSSGIMFLGVFAVLAVILYRSASGSSSASYPDVIAPEDVRTIVVEQLPGARPTSMVLDERSLFVSVEAPNGSMVLEIDRATWQVVSTLGFGE